MVTKRKLAMAIIPIFAVFCGVFGISACNDAEHVHTFSEEWTKSTTEHWHEATCDHTDERGSVGQHVDADNNGKCDVCDYAMPTEGGTHTHTFDESHWEHDANTHWHAATCEHPNEKGDEAPHVDVDGNQFCDVCGEYVAHVHKFNEEEWAFTESEHWHPATCAHEDEKGSPAAHNFADGGVCECGLKEDEITAYISLIDHEILDEEENDFYSWLTGLKAQGKTVTVTSAEDVIYQDTNGDIEPVYFAERNIKVKAQKEDGNALADVWLSVTVFNGEGYETNSKTETNAFGIAKTDANGIAEITFTPIAYSAELLNYHIRVSEKRDIAVVEGTEESAASWPVPNRYGLKTEEQEDTSTDNAYAAFEVGTDSINGQTVAIMEFVFSKSWEDYHTHSLPYKHYYEDPLKGEGEKEDNEPYEIEATGDNNFEYFTLNPFFVPEGFELYNYEGAERTTIEENLNNAAAGEYKISFSADNDAVLTLYGWNTYHQFFGAVYSKKDDGTPSDRYISSVSGQAPKDDPIADLYSGGAYVNETISTAYVNFGCQFGIKADKPCKITIQVERTGDYVISNNPDFTFVADENGNGKVEGPVQLNKLTTDRWREQNTALFDVSAMDEGYYILKLIPSTASVWARCGAGYYKVSFDNGHKYQLWQAKESELIFSDDTWTNLDPYKSTDPVGFRNIVHISDGDNLMYLEKTYQEAYALDISLEKYTEESLTVYTNPKTDTNYYFIPATPEEYNEDHVIPLPEDITAGDYTLTIKTFGTNAGGNLYPLTITVGNVKTVVTIPAGPNSGQTYTADITFTNNSGNTILLNLPTRFAVMTCVEITKKEI